MVPPSVVTQPPQNNNFNFDPGNGNSLIDGLDRLVEHQVVNYLHERTRNESVGKWCSRIFTVLRNLRALDQLSMFKASRFEASIVSYFI